MTIRRSAAILILAILTALAMAAPPAAAQDGGEPVRVGVIVHGPDGTQTFCVTLDGDEPTGADALAATGLPVVADTGFMGSMVCQIDGVGCVPPDESCFCQCEGGASCAYWSYFHRSETGGWVYSPVGAASYPLEHGAVEGWWWRDNADPDASPPPALAFEEICTPAPVFPRTVIDGLERAITLDAPPERIASVALGSDEILLALVGPERLLGVTFLAEDPAISNVAGQLDGIPHTDLTGNPERLIELGADLIVMASYSNPAALDQLLDAGEPVFVLTEFNDLDEIRANIRLLGEVTGTEARAEALIAEMDARIAAVAETVAGGDPPRVLYYEPGGITYGPGSTVDAIITLAGGANVVAEAGLDAYPLVNPEFVLATDPDVVLLGGWFSGGADPLAWFTSDPAFATLRAVREGRVIPIVDAHMTNVSHHIAQGVEDVARALYPDLFETEAGR